MGEAALWRDKKPLLGQLDIELTERCNNDCLHCCINLPASDRAARSREMSTGEVKRILDEAAALGCLQVRLTGGEPLLRPDFEELYLYARRLGLKVLIFTNARPITPHLADLLAHIPPLLAIEVTVYGMHAESYEAVTRAPGSFAQFWRGVNLLLERQVPFVVKGALLPPNRAEMDELEAWAADVVGMGTPPSYSMFFDLRVRRGEAHPADADKNRLIKSLRLSPEEGLAVLARDRERYLAGMRQFCAKFMELPGDRLFSCGAGLGGCVDAYGRYQPCMMLRHSDAVYDLKTGSLQDALTNFFPRLREMRAANPNYLARCARCFLKGLCEQCPAKSWQEHGTLDAPVAYLCQIAHVQACYLGLLAKDENAWEVEDWRERVARFSGRKMTSAGE
jgi:radical SAM protein with 4Fe4S-binding SPASM domain